MKAHESATRKYPGVDKLASLLILPRNRAEQKSLKSQAFLSAFFPMAKRLGIP